MLKQQRQDIICRELKDRSFISMEEAMALTDSSRSTILRDMIELEKEGRIIRIRGGASAAGQPEPAEKPGRHEPESVEPAFAVRQDLYLDEKRRIAKAAHSLIEENETLLLGSGTTVGELAKLLNDIEPLYVCTNDLKGAMVLAEYPNVNLTVLGGSLREKHYTMNGYFTEQFISQMHADKCFLGIDAVDQNIGYMNFAVEELQTNKTMLKHSRQSIILCDHSKFDKIAFVSICRINEIDLLITGRELAAKHRQMLDEAGVRYMCV